MNKNKKVAKFIKQVFGNKDNSRYWIKSTINCGCYDDIAYTPIYDNIAEDICKLTAEE